ncbi:hypothetical protein F8388_002276, partial [Cannabis sativa]
GYEIIEELLEMITWVRLGIHKKLVCLLNVDEPYAPSHEPIASLESSQMEQLGEYPNQDKSR